MTVLSTPEHYSTQLQQAAHFIQEHNDFLVVSHVQPDGDAAGSTFAMAWILTSMGKRFTLINEGPMPEKFLYMAAGRHEILDYEAEGASLAAFQHVISVDCADYSRIGSVRQIFADNARILNIDHHVTNDYFGTVNLVDAEAAATVEVLYDLVRELNVPYCHDLNVCIYSGLLTDTGGFRYANTSAKVMRIAADMLSRGVAGHALADKLLEKLSYPQISLIQRSLNTLNFAHDKRVAWLVVSRADVAESGASNEDSDGLVNYPRNVEGVEVGLLFKERPAGVVKVSLRSTGTVDVSQIAKLFGGGGHMRAAGCALNGTLEEAVERVVQEVGLVLR
ncbi:DHH family phosphoesterase [Paenibacillus xerothermodurans]|uniref:Bifunctional oligoribonuclease/PAP phosphatase NrnA n=1 Tax=Paenibacillus xerothermodurans TaxID=1977292 RepID=A0A2W1P5L5_PAEXE|nr:bifunctional oligoribonuclease/PAP phosphatase NrnA [Paenibacillus xerothermodurans]PZE22408.1 bifunctional oligoribonuclease/PAP phosphatase NrnA [Paenibacillus xerothermodurans]